MFHSRPVAAEGRMGLGRALACGEAAPHLPLGGIFSPGGEGGKAGWGLGRALACGEAAPHLPLGGIFSQGEKNAERHVFPLTDSVAAN